MNCKPWACQRTLIPIHSIPVSLLVSRGKDKNNNDDSNNSNNNKTLQEKSTFTRTEVTKLARVAIEQLTDQPGKCLRDTLDTLDRDEVWNRRTNLSTVPDIQWNDQVHHDWLLVDSADTMKQCLYELEDAQPTELAFDLESYNRSNYAQITCLLQLTSNVGKEYVIDPLAPGVWDTLSGLAPLFANPQIVKIGHSIGGLDIPSLHRDFGIFVVNAFDTYEAACELNLKSKGLASVCAHYGMGRRVREGSSLSSSSSSHSFKEEEEGEEKSSSEENHQYKSLKAAYQTTDWRQRPLTQPMIHYGRYDIHYLIPLRRLMMRDLVAKELRVATTTTSTINNDSCNSGQAAEEEARQVAASLKVLMRQMDEDEEEEADNDPKALVIQNQNEEEDVFVYSTSSWMEEELDPPPPSPPPQTTTKTTTTTTTTLEARDLRMNADLMAVISRSQYRCLDLWKFKSEPHRKHSELVSLIRRSKRGEIKPLTSAQLRLYDQLAQWRENIAVQEECLVGFICPMESLVAIMHKRPTTMAALRQVIYCFPEQLSNFKNGANYLDQLLELVMESRNADHLSLAEDTPIPSYYFTKAASKVRRDDQKKRDSLVVPTPPDGADTNDDAAGLWITVSVGVVALAATIAITSLLWRRHGR
jgi:ribonuclease D